MKYLYLSTIILFASCAQQTVLTGGDKDVASPVLLIDSNLKNTNFREQSFLLEFDENIQFLKGKRGVIINPEINNIEYTDDKNSLEIKWEDTLKNETTYSFVFRNSIADITENNKIKELNYVIATGDKIDSGRISGFVYKYPEKTPLKEALIIAKALGKSTNYYKSYSDSKGKFTFNNLKKDEYLLHTFEDENNNFKLDTNTEIHGFIKDTVELNDSILSIIVYEADKKISIEKVKYNLQGNLSLSFNVSIDSCIVSDLTTGTTYFSNILSENHKFYFADTIKKHVIVVQSKYFLNDTIRIASENKRIKNKLIYKQLVSNQLESNNKFILDFNQYIKKIDTSKIKLLLDTTIIKADFQHQNNLLTIIPENSDGSFKMILFPESIEGIKNIKKDTSSINFTFLQERKLSSFGLNIKNLPFKKSILQVLKNDQILKQISFSGSQLDTIIPKCFVGKYKLKLIADLDGNNYWTKGDIKIRKNPEPIFDYKGEVELKKNWITNIIWDFQNEK